MCIRDSCNRKDVLVIDIDSTFETLSCIIMASGMSKRFGSNKLITAFNGRPLFENGGVFFHQTGQSAAHLALVALLGDGDSHEQAGLREDACGQLDHAGRVAEGVAGLCVDQL